MIEWMLGMVLSLGCVSVEPRFPIVVDLPVAMSMSETSTNLQVEVVAMRTGQRASNDIDVDMRVGADGNATAMVTWRGNASRKRAPIGVYEVIVTSSAGRSAACVTVARPTTSKVADRIRPPEISTVEVIVIGRSEQRGGAK